MNNDDNNKIRIHVKDDNGVNVTLVIRRNEAMVKAKNAWLAQANKVKRELLRDEHNLYPLRFMLEGQPVQNLDTAEALEMNDDDVIEVYREQNGGNLAPPLVDDHAFRPRHVNPGRRIRLHLESEVGPRLTVQTRVTAPLRDLMRIYAAYTGMPRNRLRFWFQGHWLRSYETPEELEMEEHDEIEVFPAAWPINH